MVRIAEIDRSILAELRKNGRMSYVELAKLVGASERTVRTHVRRMEEMGTIRGYTTVSYTHLTLPTICSV